jgi:hypothetical protein
MNQFEFSRLSDWCIPFLPITNSIILREDFGQFICEDVVVSQFPISDISVELFFLECDKLCYIDNPRYHKFKSDYSRFISNQN